MSMWLRVLMELRQQAETIGCPYGIVPRGHRSFTRAQCLALDFNFLGEIFILFYLLKETN